MIFFKTASVEDYAVRSNRLCIPFAITANATPANKTLANDLADCMVISAQGMVQTTDSGANLTTETDATGIFGFVLHNLGTVAKCLKAEVIDLSSGTAVLTKQGASSTGVTASGNIAISVDSSVSLATTSLAGTLCVDFTVSKA